MPEVKIICGGVGFGAFGTEPQVEELMDVLEKAGVHNIDTARIYAGGNGERLLGNVKAGSRFTIDTKVGGGFQPGSLKKGELEKNAAASLEMLGMDKVDVFYIHAPEYNIPLSESLSSINALHLSGKFARFGLSNCPASYVREIYNHCKEHNYVLPSVYQGQYSPITRKQETDLFPTLRELGMSFYAYSPLAGGFLTKTRNALLDGGREAGRFDQSLPRLSPFLKEYRDMFDKPAYVEILGEWERAAAMAGCGKAELAYRWVRYNSGLKGELGDGMIIGPGNMGQLKGTLEGFERGPLSEEVCEAIEGVWKSVEKEAPLDCFNG
ncbi:Aldo/keto reductase [Mollisia scopiformis]|uniref:Aldo/keto reductase n=1 Tax=Mollisia scopiformis TaxID=149040 RepID=A0A194XSE6_MOLSC|nr:Aldo/keto reductase [Mollisia scopiformis]KUJ23225.1 Aldo/keto reductase [Mollisia scopiformis]